MKVAISIVLDHELARIEPIVEYLTTEHMLLTKSALQPVVQHGIGRCTYSANTPT
jgi:hypothetical protein